jgi:uncharacterized YccA/Bax inhibitor family protein
METNPFLRNSPLGAPPVQAGGPPSALPGTYSPTDPTVYPGSRSGARSATMTYVGTASAAAFMLIVMVAAAVFGWSKVSEKLTVVGGVDTYSVTPPMGLLIGSLVVGFALVMVCSFKPDLTQWLAIPYSLAEGVALGIISRMYDARFDGIVLQAILATAGVFLAMLVLYSLRVIRATPRFTKTLMAATMGIMAVYLVGFIASLFGVSLRFWTDPTPLGIGISVVVVVIAALNLIVDFDLIERGVTTGQPKAMEWVGAMGLMVTLVWLYLELLRLLAKLDRR